MKTLLEQAQDCAKALNNADGSFKTYANLVEQLITKVKKTGGLEMKNKELIQTNSQLNIDIGKCNEKNAEIIELHKEQIDNKENEISKLETKNKQLTTAINELNLEDEEEMEYIRTTLTKIQNETDINKTKPAINMILKRMPSTKKGGNPRKTRKQKKHQSKRSTYTLHKLVKKLFQIRL